MDKKRLEVLLEIIEEMDDRLDKITSKKLQLKKWGLTGEKLFSFGEECEECQQQFTNLENHVMKLNSIGSVIDESDVKVHRSILKNALSHLEKKHKVVAEGYYLSIYMSIGMSLGVVFGLTVFDNIALGIPLGLSIGLAIGAGLDADAKKKGLVI
ncbi:hypothetical protein ACERII_16835 [Evansella sp. AB-rgal1]|uniref:hypothetical protein n=1 Tax=Evansella sp. AB-rgal1 TaxID=3242696 RepID=UPI00359CC3B3